MSNIVILNDFIDVEMRKNDWLSTRKTL